MANDDIPRAGNASEKPVRRTYKKGEKILRPYDEADKVFTVISGYVKAYTINDQGVEQIQIIYSNLEIFPISWLAGFNTVRFYFEAMTDCIIDVYSKETLRRQLKSDPDITYVMLTKMADLFMTYVAQVNNLEFTYASERLAYQLLMLAERFGEHGTSGVLLPPFSYQTIGSLINLSRESVNREMAKLVGQKLVAVKKNRVYILNIPGLKKKIDRDGTNLVLGDLAVY